MNMKSKIFDFNKCVFLIKNYCAKSDRCQYQVLEKLKKYGLSYNLAQEILIDLIQENYVNDQRFTQSFCSGKFKIKKWGRNKIIYQLKQLKISDVCIKNGLKVIDDDLYIETLNDLLIKKRSLIKTNNLFEKNKKMAEYAIRKGFESELVWGCIRQLN